MIRIRNITNGGSCESPFGLDSENRLIEDLKVHNSLLKKFYNINDNETIDFA